MQLQSATFAGTLGKQTTRSRNIIIYCEDAERKKKKKSSVKCKKNEREQLILHKSSKTFHFFSLAFVCGFFSFFGRKTNGLIFLSVFETAMCFARSYPPPQVKLWEMKK